MPLHRSLIFWSGIFVMIFIGWLWRESERRVTSIDSGLWAINQAQSAVMILRTGTVRTRSPAFHHDRIEQSFTIDFFPAPLFMRSRGEAASYNQHRAQQRSGPTMRQSIIWNLTHTGEGTVIFYLPHWLILLTFASAWAGVLVWRSRRIRRVGLSGEACGAEEHPR